MTLIKSLNKIS